MLKKLRSGVTGLNDQISIDRREALNAFKNLQQFRNYAMGRQETTLTLDQQKMLEGVLGNDYCDNICGQVLSEHTDRLELKRITCESVTVQKWIDDFWQKGKFDDLQQRVHRNTIRDGNYCLMVEYDYENKKICIHREQWWDGYRGVFIGYDTYGNMLYAVKEWDDPIWGKRRVVYYDGAIERYVGSAGGASWAPFVLPGDQIAGVEYGPQPVGSDPIAIPYLDGDGQPLKIPFIHFANLSDEFENYGSSYLDGGLIGSQDQINDKQYDISACSRMTGYQRTWGKGFKLKKINNKTVQPRTGPGTFYHAEEATAEYGVLPAGDINQLIAAYKMKVESFCRATGTPLHSITGNWPSGEAIYKIETPIRGRTKARQKRFAPAWIEVMHRCIELENAFNRGGLDETAMLTAVYTDAGDRDPLTVAMADLSFWQAAEYAVSAGLPLETFLRKWGWGEDELKGMSTDIANDITCKRADLLSTDPNATDPNATGGSNDNPLPGKTGNQNPTKPKPAAVQKARKQG
jgi:hypothetical protein